MKKRIPETFVTLVVALSLSLSCVLPLSVTTPIPAPSPPPVTEKESAQSVVTAEIALRLRDLPEEWDGVELSTIPKGGTFTVYACIDVDGTEWAFGGHTDGEGMNWVGYVAARYLDGGCE